MARLLREAGFIEKTVQDSRQYRERFYQKSMRPSFSIDMAERNLCHSGASTGGSAAIGRV
jgi:hypothetical protein